MDHSPHTDTLPPPASVTVTDDIAAPSDVVFDLLTDPGELGHWLRAPDGSPTRDWSFEPVVGGEWSAAAGPDGAPRRLHGEVVEVDAPHALELTWHEGDDARDGSHVRFTLEPVIVDGEEGTRVTITHTMVVASAGGDLRGGRSWSMALRSLASLVSRLVIVATR